MGYNFTMVLSTLNIHEVKFLRLTLVFFLLVLMKLCSLVLKGDGLAI